MNVKLIISMWFLSVFSVAVFAQEDRDWSSEIYNVGEFTEIRVDGGFKVVLLQGSENKVEVKANNADVFDKIRINNQLGEVFIRLDLSAFEFRRVSLYITFKSLEKLTVKGGVNLKTNGFLDLNNFKVHIEGGANVDLNLKADRVDIYGEGGFLFDLKGVSEEMNVTINGAGYVNASELKSKNVSFVINGFGTGIVNATNTLDAKIIGVGKINYKGKPNVTQVIDGLGSVKPSGN